MKNARLLKNTVTSLLLIVFLWVLFFVTSLFSIEIENKNDRFIPSSATIAFRIDGRELAENALQSILLDAKDEKVLHHLRDLINESKEKSINDLGINFLSDIILFSVPYKNGSITGLSLNLSNADKFTKNIHKYLTEDQVFERIEDVGIILSYAATDKHSHVKKNELKAFFTKQIAPLSEKTKSPFYPKNKTKKIFQVYSKGVDFGNPTYFSSTQIQLEMMKNGIELDGNLTISHKQTQSNLTAKTLLVPKKGDFHFSSSIIPEFLQDSIDNYCIKAGIHLPHIRTISLNYRGMNIVNNGTGMHTLPELDVLIEFKEAVSANTILKNPDFLKQLETELINDQLIIGNKKYFVHQFDSHTIYLGTTQKPVYSANSDHEILSIKGNLSSILKIEGGGMIVSFLEIVPVYRASKELFNNTKEFDVTIKKVTNSKAKLKGIIYFKDGHYAMNELVKLVLDGRGSF